MSHLTRTRLEIRDLQALIAALRDRYGAVVEVFDRPQRRRVAWRHDAPVRAYVPPKAFGGRYDAGVGVVIDADGRIGLLTDDANAGEVPAIRRAYALRVADDDLTARGFARAAADATLPDGTVRRVYVPADGAPAPRVVVTVEPDGTVRITVEGMSGMGCLPLTADLVARLGGAAETTLTADAYADAESASAWEWAKERSDA